MNEWIGQWVVNCRDSLLSDVKRLRLHYALLLKSLLLLSIFGLVHSFGKNVFYHGIEARHLMSSSILLEALTDPDLFYFFIPILAVVTTAVEVSSWESLGPPRLRYFVLSLVGILLWFSVFVPFNYTLASGFWLDRLVILVLGLLSILNPGFVPGFLCSVYVFLAQFNLDFLNPTPMKNTHLVVMGLSFFSAYLILSIFWSTEYEIFPVLWSVIFASNYFTGGIQKITDGSWILAWPLSQNLELFHTHFAFWGWLSFLPQGLHRQLNIVLSYIDQPLFLTVLLLEVATVLFLIHQRLPKVFCVAFIVFHSSIFFLSGLFLWMWILIDAATLLIVGSVPSEFFESTSAVALSILFILLLPYLGFFQIRDVTWWNTRYRYRFELVAVTESGHSYPLKKSTFAPYDPYFWGGYETLAYLVEDRMLYNSASTDQKAQFLNKLYRSEQTLSSLRARVGTSFYNPRKAKNFTEFVKRTIRHRRDLSKYYNFIEHLGPPRILLTDQFENGVYPSEISGTIKSIKVNFIEAIYKNHNHTIRSHRTVRTIPIS